jgi:hypothetical protein
MKERSIAATDDTWVEVVRKQRRSINISILIRDPRNKRDHVIIISIFFREKPGSNPGWDTHYPD